jgi:hypothetical protein
MRSPLKRLEINKVILSKDPNNLSKFQVLDRREYVRRNPPPGLDVYLYKYIDY